MRVRGLRRANPGAGLAVKLLEREHPRVPVFLPVEIHPEGGPALRARAVNVSRAGLQLDGNGEVWRALFPRGQPGTPQQRRQVRLRLALPCEAGQEHWIGARVQGVIFRRIGADDYRLGLQFLSFEDDGYHCLEGFVDGRPARSPG